MAKAMLKETAVVNSPTQTLANYISGLSYRSIPPEVIAHIKLCLVDSLGCALFGSTLPWGKIITSFAKETGKGKGALIWGDGAEVPSTSAPLANGTLIHSFEMDDLHRVGVIHPGAEAIPAADALVRRAGSVDGKRFLTAVVAGYEVGCRVAMTGGASQLRRGFHPSATSGTFAAGAAAAKMLQLNRHKTLHALGIAGTQAAGLMAAQHASMVKRMHPGRSAQAGVYGALLADKGFTGIEDILEAPYGGFCSTFCDHPNLSHLTHDLGVRFETLNVGCKPYPCCGSNHTSIDALKKILRDHPDVRADNVEKIRIRATRATKLHVGWPYEPKSMTTAQMNLLYCVAVLLHDRDFFVDQVTEKSIRSDAVLKTTKKIEVVEDSEFEALGDEGRHGVTLEVQLQDGRSFSEKVLHAKGSDKHPMTRGEVLQKFRLLASRVLSRPRVEQLEETLLNLEKLGDARKIAKLLTA
ncbi:MAG: MmgE/PrpD family protein [Deltaproteobacteria bacterium]|nr:MmgE/PrpD family protein [Deltaproteobacteria bacterium]MBI2531269.1 MmgE/PrpD family protein [Deltaproteobacteria bacterium]